MAWLFIQHVRHVLNLIWKDICWNAMEYVADGHMCKRFVVRNVSIHVGSAADASMSVQRDGQSTFVPYQQVGSNGD